jgi:Integrase core domain/Integrase zinc binding domain/Chromo (CHRromatin Organisation MOdifier) domain
VHIPGEENCWADLLSRWGASDPLQPRSSQFPVRISALFRAPVAPELDADFTWPSPTELYEAQQLALKAGEEPPPTDLDATGSLLKNSTGAVWIPRSETFLQLRICIIGHCGRSGHRGFHACHEGIKAHFSWATMREDVATFCETCLHCLSTVGGLRIPRPMGHALHAERPNELLHFDFLYMDKSTSGELYVLILKDDASGFVWLVPCETADAETTATALLQWFALFGVVLTWTSDRGTHFKNTVIQRLNRSLHAHHHFTTPYCPQSNGTVETVCKEVLRACRAPLSEFRMSSLDWPQILPVLQSILNHSVRSSLGDRAPITVFTGLPADNPLRTLVPSGTTQEKSLEYVRARRLVHISDMEQSLTNMHRQVSALRTRRRSDAVTRHNEKTHVQPANFIVGDYVLVAQRLQNEGHKLRVRWRGPRKVIRICSEYIYEVLDLLTTHQSVVHANRLKFYADSQLDVTESILDTAAHNDPHFQTVVKLLNLRFNPDSAQYEVQAQWRGFDYEEPTWEPMVNLREDIPDMLESFLENHPDRGMVLAATSA